MNRIKLAIAGVGNCASALLQGIEYYRHGTRTDSAGLLHFDRRKVGRPLEEAIFELPNCTTVFHRNLPAYGVTVQMSPVLDGVADHMSRYPEDQRICVADRESCDVVEVLHKSGAEVLVC